MGLLPIAIILLTLSNGVALHGGVLAIDEDDMALTMEIAIEPPRHRGQGLRDQVEDKVGSDISGGKYDCRSGAPCRNGGICHSGSRQFAGVSDTHCLCPLGYVGPQCGERKPQFKFPEILDGGYLVFSEWLLSGSLQFEVQMQVRPKVLRPHTLLFFHNSSTRRRVFHLEANNGVAQLMVYNESQNGDFQVSQMLRHPLHLSDGESHFVDIQFGVRGSGDLFLSLEGQEVLETLPDIANIFHRTDDKENFVMKHAVYIGGHPSLSQQENMSILQAAENSLIGCLGDIRFNKILVDPRKLDFVGDAISGFGIVDCSVELCRHSTCEGASECRPVSQQKYNCLCPLGSEPPWCKQSRIPTMPEFMGNSYIASRGLRETSLTETLLEVTFMAKSPTGLLLYSGFSFDRRGDFVAAALLDGQLIVAFDLGTGPSFKRISRNLTLYAWHHFNVKRSGRSFDVTLDGDAGESDSPLTASTAGLEGFTPGSFVQLTLSDSLYIGGHPDADHISALLPYASRLLSYKKVIGFTGCVQLNERSWPGENWTRPCLEVLVNGRRVDLVKEAVAAVNIANCDSHECAKQSNICDFHGFCVPNADKWRCSCDSGYAGVRCQKVFEKPHILQGISGGTFTISAKIRKTLAAPQNEVLFMVKFKRNGRTFYVVVEVIGSELNLRLTTWNFPIGWPSTQAMSVIFANQKTAKSTARLIPSHILSVVMEGQIMAQIDVELQKRRAFTPTEIFIGGAPLKELDRLNFLKKFTPEERIVEEGETTGFRGCIANMWVNDTPITLANATDPLGVDSCLDM